MAPTVGRDGLGPFISAEAVLEEAELGDLIEFQRTGYRHWAVYVGDGFAIHVFLPNIRHTHAEIIKAKVTDIAGRDSCRINNLCEYARKKGLVAKEPSEIVKIAEANLGVRLEYKLFGDNCEYFATACRYGDECGFSGQVKLIISR
jgi:HRAS-like suppressor 3